MYPEPLQRVMAYFSHLPGVGRRTAERLALSLMNWKSQDVAGFGDALVHLREQVTFCPVCGNYSSDGAPCDICKDPQRQQDIICVVEQVPQIHVIEKAGCFHGLYHVLGGKLSPMNGVGPGQLRISELRNRLQAGGVKELLLAISPDVEGEATANFLASEFSTMDIAISRIAAGVPIGADLAFSDAATLASAIAGRRLLQDKVESRK